MTGKIVLSAILGLCALTGTAKAQVFLEEGKVVLDVTGGERINKTLTVHNTSAQDMDLKIYWEDFQYKPPYDGSKLFLASGTSPDSAGQWVKFSPQQLNLPAYGKAEINYSIAVADHVDAGHYGALFFERSVGHLEGESGVNVVSRVGCLFFIEPKDRNKKAVLENFTNTTNGVDGNFINQGNIILIPRLTYYIMDEAGLAADRGELKKIYVPPGVSAPVSVPLPEKLKPGKYTLVVNADLQDEDVVVKEIALTKDGTGRITIDGVKD